MRFGSLLGFVMAGAGFIILLEKKYIFSTNPISIAVQISCVGLMIWARLTLGYRSFHLTANPTKGELVTSGPYGWIRHPIYASLIYFSWASLISFPFFDTVLSVILITCGLTLRLVLEERSLLSNYAEYGSYSKRTKRLMPFVF